jgi:hypothetical protein
MTAGKLVLKDEATFISNWWLPTVTTVLGTQARGLRSHCLVRVDIVVGSIDGMEQGYYRIKAQPIVAIHVGPDKQLDFARSMC